MITNFGSLCNKAGIYAVIEKHNKELVVVPVSQAKLKQLIGKNVTISKTKASSRNIPKFRITLSKGKTLGH